MYYLRARWYDPLTSGFISNDPATLITGENYSYGSGNPITNTDPLGLWSNDTNEIIAGSIDGFLGIPLAGKVINLTSPTGFSACSDNYRDTTKYIGAISMVVGGGAVVKGASKIGKASKIGSKNELVYIHGVTPKKMDTRGIPRFNSQQSIFGEAADHNKKVLKGRSFLTTKESVKQASQNRYQNTKKIKTNAKGGQERDEVPPASSYASRNGASHVELINTKDNRTHGKYLRNFYRDNKIKEGDEFIYE